MHRFEGYTLDEWMAIVTIISVAGSFLIWLLNFAIKNGTEKLSEQVKELLNQFQILNDSISTIRGLAKQTDERVDQLESRFEEHIGEAKVRNQKIKSLEHEVFDDKRRNEDE
ncbi:hypothetical protein [Limosilactobacillus sp.]|uniref:hypothetical protein n=1 Tax=Limosilactobacillus sp. TaxID=2773925 RepID=UPI002A831558|nr:hypothetical protein [Limosilactobacillus sp.]MDY4865180.1 hypothetical protein [Limosilactobacillus sp.]